MKFSIKDFVSICDQIRNGKLNFLCCAIPAGNFPIETNEEYTATKLINAFAVFTFLSPNRYSLFLIVADLRFLKKLLHSPEVTDQEL